MFHAEREAPKCLLNIIFLSNFTVDFFKINEQRNEYYKRECRCVKRSSKD